MRIYMSIFTVSLFMASILCCNAEDAKNYWEVSSAEELIKAAKSIETSGGTIVLKPGIYLIDETIRFSDANGFNVIGNGWNTTIQKKGDGNVLEFVNCGFSFVRNLCINGDPSAKTGSGIVFKGICGSNTVDTCRIANNTVSGLRFEGISDSGQSSNVVKYCHFIDNHIDQLWSQYNNDFLIMGNQFGAHQRQKDLAPRTGVVLDHSSAGVYTLNFHWENEVAMRMTASHYNRIENNRFENSRKEGVIFGSPESDEGQYLTIFTGNIVHTNSMGDSGKYAAVEAFKTHSMTFCSNQIFSWDSDNYKHKSGLIIHDGCTKWIVKDNQFYHNSEKPLVYNTKDKNIIKDNILE